ncbi:MAG TPA: hypothetical protein VFY23_07605 [Candidatus Limnocylindrales bacterium]|nr:hypothetical protein [Candidatus Limnocylindrales bacterium]
MTGPVLRLCSAPVPAAPGEQVVVLDSAWTPGHGPGPLPSSIRDTVDVVFRTLDPIVETSTILDAWASRSGVVEAMVVGETSIWYNRRLAVWLWLQERVIWAHLLERLIADHAPGTIRLEGEPDAPLLDAARLIAARHAIPLEEANTPATPDATREGEASDEGPGATAASSLAPADRAGGPVDAPAPAAGPGFVKRLVRALRGTPPVPPPGPSPATQRNMAAMTALLEERVRSLGAGADRPLLVVLNHAAQRIVTPDGPRLMNAYLGSVAERLRGTRLDPILLDWRLKGSKPPVLAALTAPGMERVLSQEATRLGDVEDPEQDAVLEATAAAAHARIAACDVPAVTAGVDFGPLLAARVADIAREWLPSQERWVERFERLLRRLRVAGILVADEYHRQDWMEAARRLDVPVFAIQHGTIFRHHRGYVHDARPATLRLPHRTYVYGRWERDVLVERSVYRPEEVVVGGSPRLDLFRAPDVDRAAVRAELGVAEGDLLVVISGTWGPIYRRFHYPAVLGRLFDRPMPGVHVVIKQHPGEQDEGPYRAVIEGVAAARGFAPPPITIVRDIDLYRLLLAADAHLGVHSTVLTEAVVTGTANLLATSVAGGDLLDYVPSGVATPVATGEDLLAALRDLPRPDEATRRRFVETHFEPGNATERIAADILAEVPS